MEPWMQWIATFLVAGIGGLVVKISPAVIAWITKTSEQRRKNLAAEGDERRKDADSEENLRTRFWKLIQDDNKKLRVQVDKEREDCEERIRAIRQEHGMEIEKLEAVFEDHRKRSEERMERNEETIRKYIGDNARLAQEVKHLQEEVAEIRRENGHGGH